GVQLVWTRLGVKGPRDLQAAIADGRFRSLPGMKEKKEAKIRKGLEERLGAAARFLLPDADAAVARLTRRLREHGAERVEAVGSYRRRRETVGDLDLIVLGDAAALSEAFVTGPEVKEVLVRGAAKSSVVLATGLQIDLRPFAPESLGAALQYFTGSRAHNVAVRERAVRRGLKLNEYGVFEVETDVRIAGATEEDVYGALGLAFIPPELREDRGERRAGHPGGHGRGGAGARPRVPRRHRAQPGHPVPQAGHGHGRGTMPGAHRAHPRLPGARRRDPAASGDRGGHPAGRPPGHGRRGHGATR